VHPPEMKLTEEKDIIDPPLPEKLILHLKQHIGKPAVPIVGVGDEVSIYQKIAESDDFVSAAVHSPVKGKVVSIEAYPHPDGKDETAIIIEPNKEQPTPDSHGKRPSPDKIIKKIQDAGIVGLGGAMFPTHVKLSIPKDKSIDTLIINGAECEPYLTADSRLMQEDPDGIVSGIKLILNVLKVKKAMIGIEKNKPAAIKSMKDSTKDEKLIRVNPLPTRYPQGGEKVLIKKLTGREVPSSGLPLDIGVVVINVGTALAIHEAVYHGKPLVERIITITGDVKEPCNLRAKIGTPIEHLIKHAGGYSGMPKKILCGGPMMGISQDTDKASIIKGNNAILVFNAKRSDILYPDDEEPCIRCGKCVGACPANLSPTTIMRYSKKNKFGFAKANFAMDCFECGCCSYICPSKIDLVGWIKIAKSEISRL